MKTFQTLFPPLSPKTISLSSARRVVLVSYNAERGTVDIRHYLITVKPYGVSRRVRKILESASGSSSKPTLDLGNEKDVADFLLRQRGEGSDGYESAASSASSVAGDDADAISLADDYVGRNNRKGSKRAVRLDEIGPRLELRLIKIVEGVPGKEGGVIYHEFGAPGFSCTSVLLLTLFSQSRKQKWKLQRRRRSTLRERNYASKDGRSSREMWRRKRS